MRLLVHVLGVELVDIELIGDRVNDDRPYTETGIAATLVARAQAEREGGTPDEVQ